MAGRERYRSAEEGWPVNVNLRVRRVGKKRVRRPTDGDVARVVDKIATTGTVPRGWEVAAVAWQGFVATKTGYTEGRGQELTALEGFADAQLGGGTGWRQGEVPNLQPLARPMQEGVYQIGWERREPAEGAWERKRLKKGEWSSRYEAGEWVSKDYARRYPHKVEGVQARSAEDADYDMPWWEAEVRVDYEPA